MEYRSIKLEDLVLDLENPRYPGHTNQREAITKIVADQGTKILRLAEDIVAHGLNPSKRAMVAERPDGTFEVMEGNRRLAALKLLASKELRGSLGLRPSIAKKLTEIADAAIADGKLPTEIQCVVLTRDKARRWIELEHTGANEGVGVVEWDGAATARFRLKASLGIQAVDLVAPYLDAESQALLQKAPVTNLDRLLNTPEARGIIGVDAVEGRLHVLAPEEQSLARLTAAVSDIVLGRKNVSDLKAKSQRVAYANELAARRHPPLRVAGANANGGKGASGSQATGQAGSNRATKARRLPADRTSLIPRHYKIRITNTRINAIYDELQRLKVNDFKNSVAVLLRVFVELSVDEYMDHHRIPKKVTPKGSSTPRDMNLQAKTRATLDHLAEQGVQESQLHGMRTILSQHDHPLSVKTMHAYVHNQHYSPKGEDLKNTWDNIQAFVTALWKR